MDPNLLQSLESEAKLDREIPHRSEAGKSTLTSRLSAGVVLRVADPETARALGESLRGSRLARLADTVAGARDANGVAADAEAAVDRASSSSGAPLPTSIQRQFEGSLGADLSGVRIHTGSESAQAAHAVGAKAYTVGQDIHFGAGRYQPEDPFGMHLLAHEVAHTVQQSGGAQRRQHKLEVSTPQDAAEHEADRAADAMVAGRPATVGGVSGLARKSVQRDEIKFEDDYAGPTDASLANPMDRAANQAEKEAAKEGKLRVDTPIAGTMKLEALSSLETVSQARACITKVTAANANLYQRRAVQQGKVDDLTGAHEWKEKQAAEADVKTTDGFLGRNEGVIGTLQHIIDLGEGNSQLDEKGNRPGHDMRIGVFSKLAQKAFLDFARLQGVVNAFLTVHPTGDEAGAAGGAALGTGVATEGKSTDPAALDKIRGQVQDAQRADPMLNNHMVEYKRLYGALAEGDYDQKINTQMEKCASAVSKGKNVQLNIDLGTERPNTPEQASAKAEADKVKQELDAAKGVLNQAVDIAKLAITVMGMPEIGALGEGSALTDATKRITDSAAYKTGGKIVGTARKIDAGQATVTGVNVEKQVSADITTAVAKMLTDYDAKMNVAKGKADQANANAKRTVCTLNTSQANVAKGDIIAEFAALSQICADVEKQKNALRKKSQEITDYQAQQRKKGKKGGPDLGAMTKAHSECVAYVVQAKAAIVQGEEEQKIAKEMSAERAKVAGDMSVTKGENATPDMAGDRELASSTKADAYIDCEPKAPFLLSQHPLSFRIRSEVLSRGTDSASDDKAGRSVEVANMGVAAELDELKANLETATGFESALKSALGV